MTGVQTCALPISRALRLRWLWFEWKARDKPWIGLQTPNDAADRDLFNVATRITIGDGRMASFWSSPWLDGSSPKFLAPAIFLSSKRKSRSVHDALFGSKWITDINLEAITAIHFAQFAILWERLQSILTPGTLDHIVWTLSDSGVYSTGSAYRAQFAGAISCSFKNIVWKSWTPPKCRFLDRKSVV